MDDFDQTQALDFNEYDDETDEDLETEKKAVAHLKVPMQKGFPEKYFPVFEGDNIIGRQDDCNICIPLKALSREHACIEVRGDSHFIYDKGSRNKTKRGKHFLSPTVRYEVKQNDELTFGDITAVYLTETLRPEGDDDTGSETGSESMFQTAPVEDGEENQSNNNNVNQSKPELGERDDEGMDSDASSDMLNPSQVEEKPKKSSLFVAESDLDDSRTGASCNVTVKDTPAPRKRTKKMDEFVLPECGSDTEEDEDLMDTSTMAIAATQEPGDRSNATLMLAATQAYVCDSDAETDGEEEEEDQQKSILTAATQAFTGEEDRGDTNGKKKAIMFAATQAYGNVEEEEEEDGNEEEQKSGKVEPTLAYTMGAGIEPTQAYDMDEDSNQSTDKGEKESGDKAVLFAATQAYGMDVPSPESEDTKEEESGDKAVMYAATQAYGMDMPSPELEDTKEPAKKDAGETKYDSDTSEEFVLDEADTIDEEDTAEAEKLFLAPTLACDVDDVEDSENSGDKPVPQFVEGDDDGATQVFEDARQVVEAGDGAGHNPDDEEEAATQVFGDGETQVIDDVTSRQKKKTSGNSGTDSTQVILEAATQVFGEEANTSRNEDLIATQVFGDGATQVISENEMSPGKKSPIRKSRKDAGDASTHKFSDITETVVVTDHENVSHKHGEKSEKDATSDLKEELKETQIFDIMAASTLVEEDIPPDESENTEKPVSDEELTQCFDDGVDATAAVTEDHTVAVGDDATMAVSADQTAAVTEDATVAVSEGDATMAISEDQTVAVSGDDATMAVSDGQTVAVSEGDATMALSEEAPTLAVVDTDAPTQAVTDTASPERQGRGRRKAEIKAEATVAVEEEPAQVADVEEKKPVKSARGRGGRKKEEGPVEAAATLVLQEEEEPVSEEKSKPAAVTKGRKAQSTAVARIADDEPTQVFADDMDDSGGIEIVEIPTGRAGAGRKGGGRKVRQSEVKAKDVTPVSDVSASAADSKPQGRGAKGKGRRQAREVEEEEEPTQVFGVEDEELEATQAYCEDKPIQALAVGRGRAGKATAKVSEVAVPPVPETEPTSRSGRGRRRTTGVMQPEPARVEELPARRGQRYKKGETEVSPADSDDKKDVKPASKKRGKAAVKVAEPDPGREEPTQAFMEEEEEAATQVFSEDSTVASIVKGKTEDSQRGGRKSRKSEAVAEKVSENGQSKPRGRPRGRKSVPAPAVPSLGVEKLPALSATTPGPSDEEPTQVFGQDDETPPLTEEFVPDSEDPSDLVSPVVPIPPKSPLKSALASPERKKSPSPKRVQFLAQASKESGSDTKATGKRATRKSVQVAIETPAETEDTGKKVGRPSRKPTGKGSVKAEEVKPPADDLTLSSRNRRGGKGTAESKELPGSRVTRGKPEDEKEKVEADSDKPGTRRGRRSIQPQSKLKTEVKSRSSLPAVLEEKDSGKTGAVGTSGDSVKTEPGAPRTGPARGRGRKAAQTVVDTEPVDETHASSSDIKPSDKSQVSNSKPTHSQPASRSKGRAKKGDSQNSEASDSQEKAIADTVTSKAKGPAGRDSVEESHNTRSGRAQRSRSKAAADEVEVSVDSQDSVGTRGGRRQSAASKPKGKASTDSVDKTRQDTGTVSKVSKETETPTEQKPTRGKHAKAASVDKKDSQDDFEHTPAKRARKSELDHPAASTPKSLTRASTPKGVAKKDTSALSTPKGSSKKSMDDSVTHSPSLRKSTTDGNKAHVMFTGVTDEHGEKIVKELGGELVSSVYDCSHLVTDQIRRTVKFLCCVSRGIPIVTPQWLVCSKRTGMFSDPSAFLVKDFAAEKKHKCSLQRSLDKARENLLLSGYKIHVTKSVKPEPASMKDILQCSGAQCLSSVPKAYSEKTLVISCEADRAACEPALKAGLPVVGAEFILTGVLRQETDTKEYLLFNSGDTGKKRPSSSEEAAPAAKRRKR